MISVGVSPVGKGQRPEVLIQDFPLPTCPGKTKEPDMTLYIISPATVTLLATRRRSSWKERRQTPLELGRLLALLRRYSDDKMIESKWMIPSRSTYFG